MKLPEQVMNLEFSRNIIMGYFSSITKQPPGNTTRGLRI
jgi:hypothetical protein